MYIIYKWKEVYKNINCLVFIIYCYKNTFFDEITSKIWIVIFLEGFNCILCGLKYIFKKNHIYQDLEVVFKSSGVLIQLKYVAMCNYCKMLLKTNIKYLFSQIAQ